MISKEKFMEIKRLKEAGVPTAVIASSLSAYSVFAHKPEKPILCTD